MRGILNDMLLSQTIDMGYISTLDGVTAAIVAFIFVCLIFPGLVKNRPQFYFALAAVLFIILLHTLSLMAMYPKFLVITGALTGLLQIMAILLLVLCVGGLTVRELAGDMARAYEVMRRGEDEKEVIIPIAGRKDRDDSDRAPVYHIDTSELPQKSPVHPPAQPPKPDNSSLPLE